MGLLDSVKWMFVKKEEKKKLFEVGNYSVEITKMNTLEMIKAIKWLKDIVWIWLSEAKNMLTNFPSSVVSWVSKFDAEKIKEKLEELGLEVKIKKS